MKDAIRLTNKTAVALRRNAKEVRTAYFAAQIVLSIALGVLGVYLGFYWLPAVPLMIAAIALMDCALAVAARSRYLSLIGQAIATEAAAREMRAGESETKRQRQIRRDMQRVKEDIRRDVENMAGMMERAQGAQPFFEQNADEQAGEHAHRRRRQQEEGKPLQLIKGK